MSHNVIHWKENEMERIFVQTKVFENQFKALKAPSGLLIDIEQEVLKDIQKKLCDRNMISDTGGFTKLRVAFKLQNRGKSGSARVIYFDSNEAKVIFLMMIYSKSDMSNISVSQKKALKHLGQELKKWQA